MQKHVPSLSQAFHTDILSKHNHYRDDNGCPFETIFGNEQLHVFNSNAQEANIIKGWCVWVGEQADPTSSNAPRRLKFN
jgi:hypothetical protein